MTTPLQNYLNSTSVSSDTLTAAGIDKLRVDALFDGADPTIDEIRAIAKTLRISARQLISQTPTKNTQGIKLRQNYKIDNSINAGESLTIVDRAFSLSAFLPQREKLRYFVGLEGIERNLEGAERLASFCRTKIFRTDRRSPLIGLDRVILEKTSIYIIIDRFKSIEGASLSLNNRQFLFLGERPDARMRFTLAHEFAHYLVDINDDDSAWFDKNVESLGGDHRNAERFANAFAAALLMPAMGVGDALKVFRRRNDFKSDALSDIEIAFLARLYGVNFQVAARRCEDLQLLPRGGGQSLYKNLIKSYASPEKFADQIKLPPRVDYNWSVWLEFIVARLEASVLEHKISLGRLSEMTGVEISLLSEKLATNAHLY